MGKPLVTGGFSLQRAGNMDILSSYLKCLREEAAEQSAELSVIRDAMAPMAWLSLELIPQIYVVHPMSNTHMDVILWSVCYFGAYCISCYIALLTCPALAIRWKCTLLFHAALNKGKYLLSLSRPVFIIAQRLLLRLHFRGCPISLDWLFNGGFQVYESLTLPFSCGVDLMASYNNDNNFNRIS